MQKKVDLKTAFDLLHGIMEVQEKLRFDNTIDFRSLYIGQLFIAFGLVYEVAEEKLKNSNASTEGYSNTTITMKDKTGFTKFGSLCFHIRNSLFHARFQISSGDDPDKIEIHFEDWFKDKQTFNWKIPLKNVNILILNILKECNS